MGGVCSQDQAILDALIVWAMQLQLIMCVFLHAPRHGSAYLSEPQHANTMLLIAITMDSAKRLGSEAEGKAGSMLLQYPLSFGSGSSFGGSSGRAVPLLTQLFARPTPHLPILPSVQLPTCPTPRLPNSSSAQFLVCPQLGDSLKKPFALLCPSLIIPA